MKENQKRKQPGKPRLSRSFFTRDGITLAKDLLGKTLVHYTRLGWVRGIITEVESYMGEEDKGAHTYGGRRTERTEPMYHIGGTSYVYLIYGMYNCMNIAAMGEGISQAVLIRSVIPADEEAEQRMIALRLQHEEERKNKKSPASLLEPAEADKCGIGQDGAGQDNTAKQDMVQESTMQGSAGQDNTAQHGVMQESAMQDGTVQDNTAKQDMVQCRIKQDNTAKHKAAETDKIKRLRKHLADGPGKVCIAMGITRDDNDIDLVESDTFYVTEGISVPFSEIKAGKRIGIDYAEEAADYLWRFYLDIFSH